MRYTLDQLKAMDEPAEALLEALKTRPPPDPSDGDPDATMQTIRKNRAAHLAKLRHLYPIPSIPDEISEFHYTVKARDGYAIPIKITMPTKKTSIQASPLVILLHEGGWCLGDFTDEEHDAWLFTRDLGAVCANVEYRLAPEHAFPTGVQDCHDVVKWAAATASPNNPLLPADPRRGFIVGGSSAGGNLAAVMCQMTRDEGLQPPITGQYLSVAALIDDAVVPERWKDQYQSRKNTNDPIINLSHYPHPFLLALKVDPADPRFCPLIHEDLTNLPPAYFQICGLDPLRDEELLYAKTLEENGNTVKVDLYEGYGHMFWMNWPELSRAKDFFRDTLEGMRWLLSQVERKP